MSAELLPCPFCGMAPWGTFGPDDDGSYWIECHGADGSAATCGDWYGSNDYKSKDEVRAAWNRRATPTPPVEPVKEADVIDEVLTDDQIEDIWAAVSPFDGEVDMIEYARKIESAVLRALRGGTP